MQNTYFVKDIKYLSCDTKSGNLHSSSHSMQKHTTKRKLYRVFSLFNALIIYMYGVVSKDSQM